MRGRLDEGSEHGVALVTGAAVSMAWAIMESTIWLSSVMDNAVLPKRCFVLIASNSDTRYLQRGTLTAIRSIRRTNPAVPIVILHHDLNEAQRTLFKGTTLKHIDRIDFQLSSWSRQLRSDIPVTCYLSLCVEYINEFDVAIYIDADTVVLEPLDDLFAMDVPLAARVMDDHPLAEHFEDGEKLLERENIRGVGEYALNNGVVRFDLRYWRTNSLMREAAQLFRKYGPDAFKLTDQSLLNLVAYKTRTLSPVPRLYNFCAYPDMLRMEHSLIRNRFGWAAPQMPEGIVKVVHWTGPLKPWDAVESENRRLELCLECFEQFANDDAGND